MNQQDLAMATSRDNASITRSLIVLEKNSLFNANPDRIAGIITYR
jgi:hypothetical protein